MRVAFFGTPDFAVPTLERLLESSHSVVCVVTQPDKPAGRGRKLTPPPVKQLALEHGLEVLQPQSVRTDEFADALGRYSPDVAVVVAYGKILPQRILDLPRHGCLNIHASLLPKYRGAAPIQWAIVRGERTTGVTIMQMDAGMDTGPMIATREVPILEDDDAVSVANLLSLQGSVTLVEVLDELEKTGELSATPQNHDEATMAPLIEREDARLDWSRGPEEIILTIRGFVPWPGAFTTLGDKELKVLAVDACDPAWAPATAFDERIAPGTVVETLKGRGLIVRTGGERGVVLLTRVKPEGKPAMGAIDFANGGGIRVGDILGK